MVYLGKLVDIIAFSSVSSKKPFLNGLKGQGLLANGICFFHILVDPVQNSHNNRKFITTWTIKISVMRGQNHY